VRNALAMNGGSRRVEISFEREREALRILADAIRRVSRRPAPVALAAPARPSPLQAFALEMQAQTSGNASHARTPTADVAPPQHRTIPETPAAAGEARPPNRHVEHPPHIAATPAAVPAAPITGAARYLAALAATYGPVEPANTDAPLVDLLLIDASGLVALARGNARARAHLAHAVGSMTRIVVPATALLDAAHARIADAVAEVVENDPECARAAAELIARTGVVSPSTALAVAFATACGRAAILTADAAGAQRLASEAGCTELYVFAV